jgi:GTP-binding protein LepA
VKPMVFSGLYPTDSAQYEELRDAMDKLRLNDASFFYEPESSTALGFGFRCGFLGLLHMEIIQERLEREFDLELITTAPGVRYRVFKTDGEMVEVDSPSQMPETVRIDRIEEPYIEATILTSDQYLGGILPLLEEKRGIQKKFEYVGENRVMLVYELPLNEIVLDFYDRLKSVSRGYASLDYHLSGYKQGELVKLDVLVLGEPVDALSLILHRGSAERTGRELVSKMRS